MIKIEKGAVPASLVEHSKQPHGSYDNFGDKEGLRTSVVEEQRGLCCYCMRRIKASRSDMKIEHWQSQEEFDELQLDYTNLLGACRGGEGQERRVQHCDTYKGSRRLKWSPADRGRNIEDWIYYEIEGAIRSRDDEFDAQLGNAADGNVLNLNVKVHKNARKALLNGMAQWWKSEKDRRQGPVPRAVLEQRLNTLRSESPAKEYCGVEIWWLSVKLSMMG